MIKNLLVILLLLVSAGFAQNKENGNIDTDFSIALNFYNSYQYEEALKHFTRIADDEESNSRTAALLFKGKILFLLNKADEALASFETLYKEYPSSKYIDEAKVITAKYYLDKKENLKAFTILCDIIKNSNSEEYKNNARYTGERIARIDLSEKDLLSVFSSFRDSVTAPYLMLLAGQIELKNGNFKEADNNFSTILQDFPHSQEASTASEYHEKTKFASDETVIAALLPLTSDKEKNNSAEAILEGIKYAVSEYNANNIHKAGLIIEDTQKDSSKINDICKEVENFNGIRAFIGPVYSGEVKEVLEKTKNKSIPVLSPTATESDLTVNYPNFFQANPSLSFRGKIMAQYIFFVENKKKMAVLAASADYSSIIANAFIDEFRNLGGKIIIEEVYNSGSYDIQKQVSHIASKLKNIEGIYLPLTDKGDAAVILSQLEESKIDIKLYGNQDWLNAKGFESSSNLSNKLIFTSDYFIDYNDPVYQDFDKNFREKTGTEADRNVLYGYDAAKYLLKIIDGENLTKEELLRKLYSGQVYQGLHNSISFDSSRMNQFLNIIRYRDGIFELVDRFKFGNK